jgi:dethiobiotin synthetase
MLRIGVTGTDTAVGKTVISCALVTLLRSRGYGTGVMKPIETGVTRGEAGSDHVTLAAAAEVDHDREEICPLIFGDPLAPWVASERSSIEISVAALDEAFGKVCEEKDCVVVEGAGGLLVPITRTLRYDGLFVRWKLDLLIVAADRLGALNHTLLTVESAQRAGLRVFGVVLNQLHRALPRASGAGNATALREMLPDIPVVEFPCIEGLHGGKRLHEYGAPLDLQLLRDVAQGTGLVKLLFGSGSSLFDRRK